jgi:hypothetical protein
MSVIFYDSSETGAPVLNNSAGSLLSVVQACLVDGFNAKSVTSIVVAGNIATVTVSAHGYSGKLGKLLRMDGAAPAALNGDKQITVTGANTFTFPAPGVSNQTATGTITCKRAPLDFVRVFTGTNKAVYKSGDVTSSGLLLRIDDTNAGVASPTDARAVMYESMTDIDTGVAPGPTAAQVSGGMYWQKGANTAAAKKWVVVGDGRLFYLLTESSTVALASNWCVFGDSISYRSGDPYLAVLGGTFGSGGGATHANYPNFPALHALGSNASSASLVVCRAAAGTGSAVSATLVSSGGITFGNLGRFFNAPGQGGPTYPSPVDNGLVISRPVFFAEDNATFGHPIRGELPGLALPMANAPFAEMEVVGGLAGFAGSMLALPVSLYFGSHVVGRLMVDITGPWR